ncbi:sodium-coupled monocarboxylate transporter 1 isoform X1 [Plutella xylostella]|uniref:sodium-coupled monocarboxylate transporter 1 isoform X1 n=2 Tax=Plutella xylostella TaxID=51655 RepID=UPI002032AA3E|nr:sodium-coupled monocarboxylate transporter 1 isoform X1 [Plutella xylostella]
MDKQFNCRSYNTFSDKVKVISIFLVLNGINVAGASPTLPAANATSDPDVPLELFHWQDYLVLATMLLVSCAIGVFYGYFGEAQTTSDDFLLGGSSMGTFPMALSLAASFITAIELLGNPAEMYVSGAQFWMICVAFLLVVPVTSRLYLPVFMRLRLTSCYEYLEVRFCKAVRVYASALYMLQMILYTAVAVYAPALALSDVTGLNTYLAVSLVYVVCIFYASQGGMKAVIMTDTFQSAVLLGSLAAVLALGAARTGGLDHVWDHARTTGRLHFFDMNPDPTVRHSFWSVVVGGTVYWVSMFCANQASVQKYLSVERIAQARVALWVSALGLIAVYSVNFVTGAVLAAHYADCDPIQSGQINASDRLLPLYVVRELGGARGVPGFFVAGIFAASLGTVASALNSLAAIACQDIAGGLLGITLPENKGAVIARWVCLGFGALSFALVFLVERLGPVLQLALSFNGMAGGVSLGLFSLGMLFPWANTKGAVVGGVVGLALVVAAGGGAQLAHLPLHHLETSVEGCPASYNLTASFQLTENEDQAVFWLFRVSYLWYSALGCLATILTGLLVSVATGVRDPTSVPIDLISPPVVALLNSLPDSMKKILHVPRRLGAERRRSSSVRPPTVADDKDTRRRRRLSELAGGVFYSDGIGLTRGHDNLAMGMDSEKPPDENHHNTNL